MALWGHWAFLRASGEDVAKDEVCINGRFFYTSEHIPLAAGHAREEAYVDDPRRLDARFYAKGLQ